MSIRPDPVIPETRRRRASTTEKSERILKMSRSLTLTRSVLAGTLAEATPNQLDFCVCSIEVRPMQRNYSVRKSGRN